MSEVSRNIADIVTIHTFLDQATNALEVPEYVREAATRLGNTAMAHACEDCVPGERLGDGWRLPRPFARIKRTDQNQFNVSVWRPSARS
jgi:hypothetical protein